MAKAEAEAREHTGEVERAAKVVYTAPPLSLARLVGEDEGGWRIEAHGVARVAAVAEDVDPALLREVAARGGRVLVEVGPDDAPRIAGVLQTRRALEIDERGDVAASVRTLKIRATQELQLTTERAMILVRGEDLELYGREVLTRAREVAKILGRMITLN